MIEVEARPSHGSQQSRRQWQFSLRTALLGLLALSIIFAIASQFPRQSAFAVLMTLLLLSSLAVVATLRVPFVRFGLIAANRLPPGTIARHGPIAKMLIRPFRALGLCQSENDPSLAAGFTTSIISSIALVGLWPAIREIGCLMSFATTHSLRESWQYALLSVSEVFSLGQYWIALWKWEAWSLGRWWLLFGAILLLWVASSMLLHRWLKGDRASQFVARFLAFAPWFIVLELGFLIGVWVKSPNTVPEPSTGFVVSIYSWELWHWDCWLDRGWLIRGALPTITVGTVFFGKVLRWPWHAAVVAACFLVPIALTLSVACTVAYQNGVPLLLLDQPWI